MGEREMREAPMKIETAEKITNIRDILYSLKKLHVGLEKENPPSLFVWVIESKIRAYGRKLKQALAP